jgi:hypothetical protein
MTTSKLRNLRCGGALVAGVLAATLIGAGVVRMRAQAPASPGLATQAGSVLARHSGTILVNRVSEPVLRDTWGILHPSAAAQPPSQSVPLPFESVQPDLIAMPNSYSNSWADFDNDGDQDLAVSLGSGEVRLYRNDNGTLVSVGKEMGLPQAGGESYELRGLSWGDYDGDGFVDLLGGSTPTDKLTKVFHNLGGKKFVDVAAELGLTIPGRSSRQTSWVDYDNDGDLDVYAADRAGKNKLFQNNGGKFTQVFADGGPTVFRSTVGACWFDMDNDGDLDLSVISYEGPANKQEPHNALFRNDGAAGFVNVLTHDSPLNVADHGVQWVDYDHDGGLDLTVTRGYTTKGGHFVFRNTLPDSVKRRSLAVTVLDSKGNWTRFGAEVRLFDASGKILATRQVSTGGGYNSQSTAPLHFGLAKLAPVTVEVTFMTKGGRKKQTVTNVKPGDYYGKSLVIREAS